MCSTRTPVNDRISIVLAPVNDAVFVRPLRIDKNVYSSGIINSITYSYRPARHATSPRGGGVTIFGVICEVICEVITSD